MWQSRTILALGEDNVRKLNQSHVLLVGLGGVGAFAAEMLCRAGVGKLTIVDGDTINPTNRNRQLIALKSTETRSKSEILAKRLKDINPEVEVIALQEYIKDQRMIDILQAVPYDFVVDAIDTLSPKTYLIYHAHRLGLKMVSSMGSGGKFDPMLIQIADIAQSYNCQLADAVRKKLHKLNVYTGIHVVFSTEKVDPKTFIESDAEPNKKTTLGTISYMPAIFGCYCASVVIRELTGVRVTSNLPVPAKVKKNFVKH